MATKLIEVDAEAFYSLMTALERASDHGQLEYASDVVEPWADFESKGWKEVEQPSPDLLAEAVELLKGWSDKVRIADRDLFELDQKTAALIAKMETKP